MRHLAVLTTFLLLIMAVLPVSAATRNPDDYFFDQTLGDFSEELEVARESGKKAILIMFGSEDCPFCERMKKTVLNQVSVQDYFRKNFLIFEVDTEGDVEITDFSGNETTMKDFAFKQYRVRATPVFLFFDLQGKPVKRSRYTGAMTGVKEFMRYGRFIAEGINQKMSFTRFKRSLK